MKQEQIILLRGVMPSGKNSIPKMAVLRQHLEEAGFERVRTYIQSGNILLLSTFPKNYLASASMTSSRSASVQTSRHSSSYPKSYRRG